MQLNLEIQIQANGPVPAQDDKFYNRTQIYICSMKRYSLLIAALSSCAAFFYSCTDDDNKGIGTAEPGIYFVEKEIGPQTHAGEKLSRGIIDSNFDAAYDPDVIYLHNMSSGEKVGIPVYACEDCPNSGKGFRYRLEVKEDGSAVLTPINEDGTYSENSLTIGSSESCYFSSWESDEWKTEERKWDVKNSGILTFDPQKSSHDRFLKLYAERWDFSKIREGERLAGPPQYILSPSYVYLTRVIFKSKRKIQYDCVRFLSSGISEAMWKESGKGY